jgi:osmotically-inducible protein OsmY
MIRPKQSFALTLGCVLAAALAGCATYHRCGSSGCPDDAQITGAVRALIAQHPDLGPPNLIQVATRDHVVYLTGEVATGLQKDIAESIALKAPGVARVMNSIAEEYSGQ